MKLCHIDGPSDLYYFGAEYMCHTLPFTHSSHNQLVQTKDAMALPRVPHRLYSLRMYVAHARRRIRLCEASKGYLRAALRAPQRL